MSQTNPELLKWGVIIAGVAAALGPLLVVLGAVVSAIGTIAPALLLVVGPITVVVAAVGALYLAWKNWDKIEPIVRNLYQAVKRWVVDRLNAVWDSVKGRIDAVTGWFRGMYEAVVGNSYVPDMVDEIGDNMGRLDGLMVEPALAATDAVTGAFDGMASGVERSIQSIVRSLDSGDLKGAAGGLLDILGGSIGGGSNGRTLANRSLMVSLAMAARHRWARFPWWASAALNCSCRVRGGPLCRTMRWAGTVVLSSTSMRAARSARRPCCKWWWMAWRMRCNIRIGRSHRRAVSGLAGRWGRDL